MPSTHLEMDKRSCTCKHMYTWSTKWYSNSCIGSFHET